MIDNSSPLRPNESLSNWMTNLPAEITKQPLNQLAIPGSHDSFTSSINCHCEASPDGDAYNLVRHLPQCIAGCVLPPWTKTQAFTMVEQLQQGIRYLDLRVAIRPNENDPFYLVHGQYVCPIGEALIPVAKYLRSYPQEILLLDCNHCYGFETDQQVIEFEKIVCNILDPFLYPWQENVPTLDEMWKAEKQVLFFSCLRSSGTAKFWPGWQMVSLWPNTSHLDKLIQFLDEHYDPSFVRSPNRFYVFQGVLTPDARYIVTHPCGSVRHMSKAVNKAFIRWIKEPKHVAGPHGINVTLMNYVSVHVPDDTETIIQLNYKTWTSEVVQHFEKTRSSRVNKVTEDV